MLDKINGNRFYKLLFRIIILVLLTYGFFYSGYKLWTPEVTGGSDFYEYYKMFQNPFNNSSTSPFIYRQFTAWTVYLISRLNLSYNTIISFSNPIINQNTFFAVIMSNYLALILTSLIISYAVEHLITENTTLIPLTAGLLLFFSFNTIPHNLSGIFEAWSYFFYALIFLLYLKKSNFIYLIISISIFQREIIPLVFSIISFLDYTFDFRKNLKNLYKINYSLKVLFVSLISSFLYFLIRTQFFPVIGYENQLQLTSLFTNLLNFRISFSYFIPVFLSQNILIIYLASVFINRFETTNIRQFIILIIVYLFLILLGVSTGIGSNTGRILSQLNPIIIILMFNNFHNCYINSD